MHAIASARQMKRTDPSVDSLRVAFVQSTAQTTGQSTAHTGTLASARHEPAAARAALDLHRGAFLRAQLPCPVLCSAAELERELACDATCVAILDADELRLEDLMRLLEIQSEIRSCAAAQATGLHIVAWCSQSTSPAKLWRLFQAGAFLCERGAPPEALLRACQSAARAERAPLLRFSERAGFSSTERRAFLAECAGLSKCEAADEIGCSQRTLETYWSRIFAKLRIRSTDGVVAAALRFAMLHPGSAAA